jgi:hypothetical protein
MIAVTIPTLGSSQPSMTIHLPFDPILLGFIIPLTLIGLLAHSWHRHERRRQSSMSLRYDDAQDIKGDKHAKTLSELRSNPAAKDVIESNQAAASEQRQKAEEKEYLGVFPDLAASAQRATVQERKRMAMDKELYWKLQNLEDHPGEFILCIPPRLDVAFAHVIITFTDDQTRSPKPEPG